MNERPFRRQPARLRAFWTIFEILALLAALALVAALTLFLWWVAPLCG